jgi:hypothetical protein
MLKCWPTLSTLALCRSLVRDTLHVCYIIHTHTHTHNIIYHNILQHLVSHDVAARCGDAQHTYIHVRIRTHTYTHVLHILTHTYTYVHIRTHMSVLGRAHPSHVHAHTLPLSEAAIKRTAKSELGHNHHLTVHYKKGCCHDYAIAGGRQGRAGYRAGGRLLVRFLARIGASPSRPCALKPRIFCLFAHAYVHVPVCMCMRVCACAERVKDVYSLLRTVLEEGRKARVRTARQEEEDACHLLLSSAVSVAQVGAVKIDGW